MMSDNIYKHFVLCSGISSKNLSVMLVLVTVISNLGLNLSAFLVVLYLDNYVKLSQQIYVCGIYANSYYMMYKNTMFLTLLF